MKLEKGGFILTKVTDYGTVKTSRKVKKKSVKMPRDCMKADARSEIRELSTKKKVKRFGGMGAKVCEKKERSRLPKGKFGRNKKYEKKRRRQV